MLSSGETQKERDEAAKQTTELADLLTQARKADQNLSEAQRALAGAKQCRDAAHASATNAWNALHGALKKVKGEGLATSDFGVALGLRSGPKPVPADE